MHSPDRVPSPPNENLQLARQHFLTASNHHKAGNREAALASYDMATALDPGNADAWNNRGAILYELGRSREAIESYDRALQVRPDHFDALINRGGTHIARGEFAAALESFTAVVALEPSRAAAWHGLGYCLRRLGRHGEALAGFKRATACDASAVNWYFQGLAELSLELNSEAAESFASATKANPRYIDGWEGRGAALMRVGKYPAARECYEKVFALQPNRNWTFGTVVQLKLQTAEWANHDADLATMRSMIGRGEKATMPFTALGLFDDPALQRRVAEIYAAVACPPGPTPGPVKIRMPGQRMRVGYFSADFHSHATVHLMAGLFEQHDRTKFEIIAFSFGPAADNEARNRVERAFDRFIDVRSMTDIQVAKMARDLEIDIAIDLKGYTQDARPGIFAARAAPIQVNYLGFPGTLAANCFDYLIADQTIIPASSRRHYSETVVYLPHCYQVNDDKRRIADWAPTRTELDLPESGFVFSCFNNTWKITPPVFDMWMRLLTRVDASVLWLLEDNALASMNLRREAERRGVDGARLIFAKRIPMEQHLARQRAADLFLDTAPYNAHTTASDALWAGLPVLTCMGHGFQARVAASLLKAIGLPEMVTTTLADYESVAMQMALEPMKLNRIRERLAENRKTSPLFDTRRYSRAIEAAFEAMAAR
ncbi:MAG: tetratricopeptide repeat protein [Rhizobiaceae bacterium]|nr:tetratricopeptide repeat protein [Rhizobiaceae bacterium]